jgi:cytochrome c oxidase subunit 2
MLFTLAAAPSTLMPFAGTAIAREVDVLYKFLLVISAFSFLLLIGGMVYFVWRYKRQSATDKTAYISHNHLLEFLWSFIPFVIFMVVFAWGWKVYHEMRSMPKDAFEVNVTGSKWIWKFSYKSGKSTLNELYVPANTPVKLLITSAEADDKVTAVLHSFYVPAFRIKQDAVPGRYTALWFEAETPGTYQVFCAEYCGTGHSGMMAKVIVLPKEQFDAWLSGEEMPTDPNAAPLSMADKGKAIFNKVGCTACHNPDHTAKVGPGLAGIYGHDQPLTGGQSVKVDENYLHESILNPQAKIVKGFESVQMLSYQGQLSEDDVAALIEFIKSLK